LTDPPTHYLNIERIIMPKPVAKRAPKRVAPRPAPKRVVKTARTKAPTAASRKTAAAGQARAAKVRSYNAAVKNTVAKPSTSSRGSVAIPPKRDIKGPGGHIGNAVASFFDIGNFLKSLGGK
jgi:hypothetical protein